MFTVVNISKFSTENEMSPVLLMFARFAVFAVSGGAAFFALGALLYKFEGGLYSETEVPLPPMDAPHRRARRSFYLLTMLVTLVVSLLGLLAYKSVGGTPTWSNLCFPALGGAWFSMLYAALTRSDRVRPRRK
jgi:hypothetical protein